MQHCIQVKPGSGKAVVVWLTALIVMGSVDERKMGLTALHHWTLNLLLPVGRDVSSHCGIKRSTLILVRAHTKGVVVFSVLFSRVTAWVNRLFEASENWISEAALLFFPVLALRLHHWQVKVHFELHQDAFFIITVSWMNPGIASSETASQPFFNKSDVSAVLNNIHVVKLMASALSVFSFADNCNGPLVSALPHSSFQSSSQSSVSFAAYNAKLNRRDGEYKWGCFCTESVFLNDSDVHHQQQLPVNFNNRGSRPANAHMNSVWNGHMGGFWRQWAMTYEDLMHLPHGAIHRGIFPYFERPCIFTHRLSWNKNQTNLPNNNATKTAQ